MVKPAEMVHWKQLSLEYMTEESDDPEDDNVIIEHRLQWRSESKCCSMHYMCLSTYIIFIAELEEFMQILDQRHEAKAKKDKGTMAKKVRRVGTPSCSQPPSDAPTWTVKHTGQFPVTEPCDERH